MTSTAFLSRWSSGYHYYASYEDHEVSLHHEREISAIKHSPMYKTWELKCRHYCHRDLNRRLLNWATTALRIYSNYSNHTNLQAAQRT